MLKQPDDDDAGGPRAIRALECCLACLTGETQAKQTEQPNLRHRVLGGVTTLDRFYPPVVSRVFPDDHWATAGHGRAPGANPWETSPVRTHERTPGRLIEVPRVGRRGLRHQMACSCYLTWSSEGR